MAQRRSRGAARLARRYGVTGRLALAGALSLAMVALVVVVAVGALGTGGVTIERGEGAAVEVPAVSSAPSGPDADDAGEKDGGAAGDGEGDVASEDDPAVLVVHVDGAVAAPGVYELAEGARVNDAIAAAGGLAEGADTSSINLAAGVLDGEKVYVPLEGEDAPAAAEAGSAGAASGADDTPAPVNINTATIEELDELPTLLDMDVVFMDESVSPELAANIERDGVALMDKFTEKFEKLKMAVARLEDALAEYDRLRLDTIRDGVIQRFEFCAELAWKTAREYLIEQGYAEVNSPKAVMKQAYADGLIPDGWLELLNDRNLTSHVYDDAAAAAIFERIAQYHLPLFKKLIDNLENQ